MKRLLILLCLFLLHSVTYAQENKALTAKNGFRNYKLGTPRSAYPNLKRIGTEFGLVYYSNPADKLAIGPYQLKSIRYEFYKDRLMNILVCVDGMVDGRGVEKTLQELYGPGKEEKHDYDLRLRRWHSPSIALTFSECPKRCLGSPTTSITYTSWPIALQKDFDERAREVQQQRNARNDL